MEFQDFPKMARLTREVIVTEKIDGTNAQVFIAEDGTLLAGSRTRWITPADDNFGFAAWVEAHHAELLQVIPDFLIIGVKNMRAILMEIDAFNLFCIDIASNVRPLVDNKD